MFRPHYVSLPEAARTTPSALEDTTKTEEGASMADTTTMKEGVTGQVPTTANTSSIAAMSSTTPVNTTTTGPVGGAVGVASHQPVTSGAMNQPQIVRPPPPNAIPSQQAAQQGRFPINQGMPPRPMGHEMMDGRLVVPPGNRMMPHSQHLTPAMAARQKLVQIRADNVLRQQQLRAVGGGQYPAGAGPMMGNPPPPNYQAPMMNPATAGGMPPGTPGGMMSTHDMMMLRHQQAQQRRLQFARLQQIQMHRQRAAAMQQMAAGGYPAAAGAAQGQQYAMRAGPGPMQANPAMPMTQMMPGPQQAQYVQPPPRPGGMMMPAHAPRPPGQPGHMGYQPGMNPGQPPMYR